MTDKVQKIREEVVRLKSNLIHGACASQIAMETYCKEEAYDEVLAILDTVQEEPVSNGLEEASKEWLRPQLDKSYANYGETKMMELTHFDGYAMLDAIEFGAKWQKSNLWKPADGDDLPIIDREVIVLLNNGRVAFGHRPPEYWDGKDIITGNVTRNHVERYDKGLWNIPNAKYWLDVDLPKQED